MHTFLQINKNKENNTLQMQLLGRLPSMCGAYCNCTINRPIRLINRETWQHSSCYRYVHSRLNTSKRLSAFGELISLSALNSPIYIFNLHKGRSYIYSSGCRRTHSKMEKQWFCLIFHHICTLKIKIYAPIMQAHPLEFALAPPWPPSCTLVPSILNYVINGHPPIVETRKI